MSKYDLRFILNVEPQRSYGRKAKEENQSSALYDLCGFRYMGFAKACDDLWYSFDVCKPTERATDLDTLKRRTSSTVMLLVYVRKDCLL